MKHNVGQIEVICGSMFCGKTEELIRRVRRAIIARQHIMVFKPAIDDRYSLAHVTSHNGQNIEALSINKSEEILAMVTEDVTVIAIDEAQFFDENLINVVDALANRGIRIIIAGLDMDFRGEPFGPMPQLLCCAEEVLKLHAICVICGEPANRTQRLINGNPARYDDPIILVGASESYEARCREHHIVIK